MAVETLAPALVGKRVGVVLFAPYPADTRPRRAAETMAAHGMDVEVICLREHPGEPRRDTVNGVRIARVPIRQRRAGILAYLAEYCSFLVVALVMLAARSCRRRLDLVHVHNMPDVLVFSALVPKLLGARVILDLHDPMPELMTCIFGLAPSSPAVRGMRLLERRCTAFADAVITTNVAFKRLFAKRIARPDQLHIIMNSPDEQVFAYRPFAPRARGPGRPFVVMYHGTIVERHGLDLAVEAVAALRADVPGIRLRVYGPRTAFLDDVMATVKARAWDDVITYGGARGMEDIVAAIDECDIGIVPNRRSSFTDQNFPTRIFEFLSRGKPVIAPRTAGILDYFGEEDLLFFVPGDVKGLARALARAYADPHALAGVVARGQRVYLAHRWSGEQARLLTLVRDLLAERVERVA